VIGKFIFQAPSNILLEPGASRKIDHHAESYGAKGSKVQSTAELIPTLERAFKGGGVHLVSVPIDYSENTRVLIDELREKLKQVDEPVA
jgi:acetolactate synthase-1/2/3 large subunit